jgi:penicillin-binding protein 1A
MIRWLAAGLVAAVLGVSGLGGLVWWYSGDLPAFETLADYRPPQVTTFLANDGTRVGETFIERRTVLPFEKIPPVMVHAIVSAEDKHFFQHSGVDYVGIAKAFLGRLRPGGRLRGASTITQQVVKTMLLTRERKLSRKIKEAILARRLEKNLGKNDILHIYLNQIYFGHGRYGIEEAARFYFAKGASELTAGEAAALASIPKDPNVLNPRADLARLKERQVYVLNEMVQNGFLSKVEADREVARPIVPAPLPPPPPGAYYVEEARRQVEARVGAGKLQSGGLTVRLRMDTVLQRAAEESLDTALRSIDKRQGFRGAVGRIENDRWPPLADLLRRRIEVTRSRRGTVPADALVDLRRVDLAKVAAADLETAASGAAFVAKSQGALLLARVGQVTKNSAELDLVTARATLPLSGAAWARPFSPGAATPAPKSLEKVLGPGDLVFVRVTAVKDGGAVTVALEQEPKVQGALVAIDPQDRSVKALVGGADFRLSSFNRATQGHRQPGSAFKPFVYAAALDAGQQRAQLPEGTPEAVRQRCLVLHPRQEVNDAPEEVRDPWTGKPWRPRNFERDAYDGAMPLRRAYAESKNTVAVKLLSDIGCDPLSPVAFDDRPKRGLEKVRELARAAGIDSPSPDGLSAALGAGEVVPLELVNAYATFAANGRFAPPVLIEAVTDPSGKPLDESLPAPATDAARGLRPELAFVTSRLMQAVVDDPHGTARSAKVLERPVAGKTGTASEHRDAWFVGFTPELVAGTWVGFDDHTPMGPHETGAGAALPAWVGFMKEAATRLSPRAWELPANVVAARIDPATGLLASEDAADAETEYYLEGTEPKALAADAAALRPEDFMQAEP